MSDGRNGLKGAYQEPAPELSFQNFVESLLGRVIATTRTKK
jgi:hypothetical protein